MFKWENFSQLCVKKRCRQPFSVNPINFASASAVKEAVKDVNYKDTYYLMTTCGP